MASDGRPKINEANTFFDLLAARQQQAQNDYQKTANSFETGWKEAFAGYTSAAKNSADVGKKAFESMTNGMTDALTEWAMTGKITVRDFANTFIREMIRMQMQQVAAQATSGIFSLLSPVIGGLLGGAGAATYGPSAAAGGGSWLGGASGFKLDAMSANGNAFAPSGLVEKFANGGTFTNSVVNQATPFMFANGGKFGVMGEAGPEAILPLQRNSSGQLGVVASGAGGDVTPVTVNVTVNSDGTSEVETNPAQSGNQFGNLIAAAVQQEILKHKRNGGMLASTNR